MRLGLALVWVGALAGCGRLGFDGGSAADGGRDAAGDAPSWIADGLVVRYPMDDDPRGGVVASAELPATCNACPTPVAGVHGGAYHFDGTQTFPIPSTTLVGAAPFTVALWFRVDTLPGSGNGISMVEKALSTASQSDVFNLLAIGGENTFDVEASVGGGGRYVRSVATLDEGAWHHGAATWNGTTARLYLDGIPQNEAAGPIDDSAEPLRVGADRDNDILVFFFQGSLDELQFYGRALAESEVARLAAP